MRLLTVLAFAASTLVPSIALAADFTVTGTFPSYTINGQPNPTLSLVTGHTYTFQVNAPGHPFDIKTAQVTGSGSQFNTGVTNNGLQTGTLTFAVPAGAPPTLFYQCEVHAPMTGVIQISAPAPAVGPFAIGLLALTLSAAGFYAYRRRAVAAA